MKINTITAPKISTLVVPSRIKPELDGEVEETEIAADISVPTEGGWGWVVVLASFLCCFVVDGIFYTFGSIYLDIVNDMNIETTLVALINSLGLALLFISGPIVSALINRFGFRFCAMAGSIITSISLFCAYFSTNYTTLLIFYGIIAGFGSCLIMMPSAIVVGFYFQRLRATAMVMAGAGSSVGIMIMFFINSYLVNNAGWRITTLFHTALLGALYFVAMAYRPLLSLTVTTTTTKETTSRTVTYLPALSMTQTRRGTERLTESRPAYEASGTERLFSAVSNINFPTAAAVIKEGGPTEPRTNVAGPSSTAVSKLTLTARNPKSAISKKQLSQVKTMMSRSNLIDRTEIVVPEQSKKPPAKRKWLSRLFHWDKHIPESRPMYRDDAFYEGRIEKLPAYQKSVVNVAPEERTGLEYQMAVSRAVAISDLEERTGLCTTAVRRILATMLDPQLLRRVSFLLLCFAGLISFLGILIPYVFLPTRNHSEGIDPKHCSLFVSAIGLNNAVGRVLVGIVVNRFISPFKLFVSAYIITGIATAAYNFSFNIIYQYFCCAIFGIFVAMMTCLRGVVIVDLYGLEKLTNATGVVLLFQGIGSLISTPLSSILRNNFGFTVSFYVAGFFIFLSGVLLIPVQKLVNKEKDRAKALTETPKSTK